MLHSLLNFLAFQMQRLLEGVLTFFLLCSSKHHILLIIGAAFIRGWHLLVILLSSVAFDEGCHLFEGGVN